MRVEAPSPIRGSIIAIVCVLFSFIVAGCVDGSKEPPAPTTLPDPPAPNVVQPNNATGCSRVFPAIFIDRAHAQSLLPRGFVAGDSSAFFGQSGGATGRGVLVVSMMRCASSEWEPEAYFEAMAGVFVQPPKVQGVTVRGEHFYELGRAYPDGAVAKSLGPLAWPRIGDSVVTDYGGEPTRAASGSIRDEAGLVFSAAVPSAGVEDSFTGTLHLYYWHQTATGLGSFEYEFRPDGFLGTGSCEARPGSVVARALGTTPCSALFMVGPPYSVIGRFEHRAGVTVDA